VISDKDSLKRVPSSIEQSDKGSATHSNTYPIFKCSFRRTLGGDVWIICPEIKCPVQDAQDPQVHSDETAHPEEIAASSIVCPKETFTMSTLPSWWIKRTV